MKVENNDLKVMIFSWNTASLPLSALIDEEDERENPYADKTKLEMITKSIVDTAFAIPGRETVVGAVGSVLGTVGGYFSGASKYAPSYFSRTAKKEEPEVFISEQEEVLEDIAGDVVGELEGDWEEISKSDALHNIVIPENERYGVVSSAGATYSNFMRGIIDKIRTSDIDIFVAGLQEDRRPSSWFHSHLLPRVMEKLNYHLVGRAKFLGMGVSTLKERSFRGLRTSIYAKNELYGKVKVQGDYQIYTAKIKDIVFRSKGALELVVSSPKGTISIINTHFPHKAATLALQRHDESEKINVSRINAVAELNNFYADIYKMFIINKRPANVLLFGDLNYRTAPYEKAGLGIRKYAPASEIAKRLLIGGEEAIREYYKFDELRESMDAGYVYPLKEGINNEGPMFKPTCKRSKGRSDTDCNDDNLNEYHEDPERLPYERCWKTGTEEQRVPSWCDRILYASFNKNGTQNDNMQCEFYGVYDVGNMHFSDHAGIIGIYSIKRNENL